MREWAFWKARRTGKDPRNEQRLEAQTGKLGSNTVLKKTKAGASLFKPFGKGDCVWRGPLCSLSGWYGGVHNVHVRLRKGESDVRSNFYVVVSVCSGLEDEKAWEENRR